MTALLERETSVEVSNPLGIEGIEFVEYTTPRPQALGQVLEAIGFRPVARHRSREILLYRQGGMNIVVNGHGVAPGDAQTPQIAAVALRVHDAGASRIYFIDRWREFSIYDVDFVPIPTVETQVPAVAGLHWFGVVQYVGTERSADWCAFYTALFGFTELPAEERFGILPRGRILASPCGTFYLQLIEPDSLVVDDTGERLQRVAFGASDVPAAVKALRGRGVDFVETDALHTEVRGALTRPQLGGVMFELVHHAA